jgi:hypothetical protein
MRKIFFSLKSHLQPIKKSEEIINNSFKNISFYKYKKFNSKITNEMKKHNFFGLIFLKGLVNAVFYQEYMTHYWPIENGQMNDKIESAHMVLGSATSFTTDRFRKCKFSFGLKRWLDSSSARNFTLTRPSLLSQSGFFPQI